jgi:hypothetical protein
MKSKHDSQGTFDPVLIQSAKKDKQKKVTDFLQT